MQSNAKSVSEYLASLPVDRRAPIEQVLNVVRKNMDPAIREGMMYGMIGWYVPHEIFAPGYHVNPKTPLPYAALASQKQHMALYLMTAYGEGSTGEAWIRTNWPKTAKKLDMGKSCIRFKRVEDLALDVVGEAIARVPVQEHLAWYARVDPRNGVASGKARTTATTKGTKGAKKAVKKTVKKAAKQTVKKAATKRPAAKKK